MTISEYSETFFGKTVRDYQSGQAVSHDPGIVYRLATEYDDKQSMVELLQEFLGVIDKANLEALVIGAWDEAHSEGPTPFLNVLIERSAELPKFKALFVGDMTYEQCEISWIIQGDYAPILQAFPRLEELRVRGSSSLQMPVITHMGLRHLTIECGGLPKAILSNLAASSFPSLEHFELWLGTEGYGFDGDLSDVRQVVHQHCKPGLRYLGLRDSEIADELAQWFASEPEMPGLEVLDFSLGTLSDVGGKALCKAPHFARLKRLDLSHHYLSEQVQQQLRAVFPMVVLDDPQKSDDEDRYVAVGE